MPSASAAAVRVVLAALVAWCGAGPACAAERPLWEAGVGVGALQLPHYRGSDRHQRWVLPVPYLVYRGEWLRADRDGARARLIESDRAKLEVSLAAGAPTRSHDDPAREGMDDLAPTLELGPTLNLILARGARWSTELRLPVRAVFTVERRPRAIGWTAATNLAIDGRIGDWNLGLLGGPLWNSRRLDTYVYGVSEADATAQRPAYRPPGGFAGWQATVSLSRRFQRHWVGLFARVDDVGGASFADSPLVRRDRAPSFGIAWAWVPWQSEHLVSVPDDAP